MGGLNDTTQSVLACGCEDVAELVSDFDVMIADPPYREHVHKAAVSCASTAQALASDGNRARARDLGFGHLTPALRRQIAAYTAKVKKWSIIYSDTESTNVWRNSCQAARIASRPKARSWKTCGEAYIRTIPWVRWSMPQLSEDRPTTGHEMLTLYWGSADGAKQWNGPGNLIKLRHEELDCPPLDELSHTRIAGKDKHKTEKPLDQALDLVEFFSNPGDTVFDPTCGRGTVGLACALLGRNFVGCELDPVEAELAQARIDLFTGKHELSKRDADRYGRFADERARRLATIAKAKKPSEHERKYFELCRSLGVAA